MRIFKMYQPAYVGPQNWTVNKRRKVWYMPFTWVFTMNAILWVVATLIYMSILYPATLIIAVVAYVAILKIRTKK